MRKFVSEKTAFVILTLTMALATVHPAFAGYSGQTKCYDGSKVIPCPKPGEDYYGQDGNYTNLNPRSYTKLDKNGNELPDSATSWVMVRDNVTGLFWEVKTYESRYNTYTWYDAKDFINALNTENFGEHSDWRLPTIRELASIVNLGKYRPAIDVEYFPRTRDLYCWSATAYANDTSYAWCVNFTNGDNNAFSKSGRRYVRGVRSGQ